MTRANGLFLIVKENNYLNVNVILSFFWDNRRCLDFSEGVYEVLHMQQIDERMLQFKQDGIGQLRLIGLWVDAIRNGRADMPA